MRVRALLFASVALSACAVVTGLGDYELVPDGVEAGLDANASRDASRDAPPVQTDAKQPEGQPDASVSDANTSDANAPDANDASADAGGKTCADLCKGPGASCLPDGTCVLGGASASEIVCPEGIPCQVNCPGLSDCSGGVDCGKATRCDVRCAGSSSCSNNGVRCAGKTCEVTCSGNNACKAGVECNATDHCGVHCTGSDACSSGIVKCTSPNGDCELECGTASSARSCNTGVACTAGTTCKVLCLGKDSCRETRTVATADTVEVTCNENACMSGVSTSGKSAKVICGSGRSCEGHIQCNSAACVATCESDEERHCCGGTSICTTNGCSSSTNLTQCQ